MRWWFAILLPAALAACGSVPSEPIGLDHRAFRSSHEAGHEPWGPLALRHVRDERPGWELGRFNYLNESYFSEELFRLPVPATLKRLLYRELGRSGAFRPEPEVELAHYLLDVTIRHYYLKTDRDLLTILPVIPALSSEIHVDLEIRLSDVDGRLFLEKRYDSQSAEAAALLSGVEGSGAERLVAITAALLDAMIRDLDLSVPSVWAELGRSVPVPGAE